MSDLSARREAILAHHRELELRQGSGWHKKDLTSPLMNDQMLLSERPIAFVGNYDAVLVGPCADKVRAAAAAWLARGLSADPSAQEERAAEACRAVAQAGPGDLRVNRLMWNDLLYAANAEGVLCCATQLEP